MDRFALHAQGNENGGHLRGTRLTAHDRTERLGGILGA
jgi:hypothetical protein